MSNVSSHATFLMHAFKHLPSRSSYNKCTLCQLSTTEYWIHSPFSVHFSLLLLVLSFLSRQPDSCFLSRTFILPQRETGFMIITIYLAPQWYRVPSFDRNDEEFVKLCGMCKVFHTGRNSSCQQHIHQHYEVYRQWCKESNIPEHHWAIPQIIWKKMEEERMGKDVTKQGTLDGFMGSK